MSFRPEISDLSLWKAMVDTQPLTASGQTRLGKVLALTASHPEASCVLGLFRRRVVGIATRSDLLRALATHQDWNQVRFSQVYTRPVITVKTSAIESIFPQLVASFGQHPVNHLPVVDAHGDLVGVARRSKLLQALCDQGNDESGFEQTAYPDRPLLRKQSQRAQLVAQITLKIRQSLQLREIFQTTVDEVKRLLGADRVLIYQVFPDGTGKTVSEVVEVPYPSILDMTFPEEVFPMEYQTLYAKGRVHAVTDVNSPDSGLSDCLVDFIQAWSIRAKLIVPILNPMNPVSSAVGPVGVRQQLWGLLIAHQCSGPRQWSTFEKDFMQQLSGQISLAFSQGQLLEYLEDRVRLRTTELTQTNQSLQREIQERQVIEATLRQREAQLRLITNHLPVLIAYVDAQQRYRFNNQVYQDWLGHSPAEIKGRSMLSVMGKAYYQKNKRHIDTVLAGASVRYESELTFQDGRSRSVSVTYVPHWEPGHSGDEQVKGFFALTSDISDRKAIERMKDEFIAVVSHELRTPLTSIHTSLKLLATGRLGELSQDGQQMLEVADENTDRLVRLVNNVLDLQRIESGEVTMNTAACDAAELIAQAAEAMQTMAQQHDIEIHTRSVSLLIWADPDYIIRTLTNLVGNAIKFSDPGSIIHLSVELFRKPRGNAIGTVEAGLADTDSNSMASRQRRGQALFCVQDSGQGIPAHRLSSIFERFQQVDSSDSREKGGTGLGLTICRKIVEQHGGEIWAESQLGSGSQFYFTIPLDYVPRSAK
ncbi:MAG: ATP-binding protein [Cyanobacteria bacterium J06606_4]